MADSKNKRGELRLINDILSVLLDEGEANKLTLLHGANLDSRLLYKYLNILKDAELVELENKSKKNGNEGKERGEEEGEKRRRRNTAIRITDKGRRFIILYRELMHMIDR